MCAGDKEIKLFEESCSAGSLPSTNEKLYHDIVRALKIKVVGENLLPFVEQDTKGRKVLAVAKATYRAIGRVMASCLATGNVISPTALPQLFRNGKCEHEVGYVPSISCYSLVILVLIRNIKPSNILYCSNELLYHLYELDMNQKVMDDWADDDTIHEQNPFLKFKMVAEKNLITTRSVALDSMQEGLTLNGKKNY